MGRREKRESLEAFNKEVVRSGVTYADIQKLETQSRMERIREPRAVGDEGRPVYILGYRKGQRTRPEDFKAHEMHIGFSAEEKHRCRENPHRMFVNVFPLVEMGLERKDNYAYIKDVWGLETRASACTFCPFHRNYFFWHLKENEPEEYKDLVVFDEMLEREQPKTKITSKLYISRSRKRIAELIPEECMDAECFKYCDQMIWNGF